MNFPHPSFLLNRVEAVMAISTPLLPTTTTTTSSSSSETDDSSDRLEAYEFKYGICGVGGYRSLAVLTGHVGSVSCLALCGEFILSASQGKDIIVWQQPDLRQFTKFGTGDGSVKALVSLGNKVFTAHQDSRIRVWKVSRRSENVFRLIDTLPTTKDYLGKFMKQSNYIQTRRHHKCLWIEHADSISCLAVDGCFIYSGSWDKTLKVWRISDLKCLESIMAHDDAINGVVIASKKGGVGGVVYSASADGKIKAWSKQQKQQQQGKSTSHSLKGILQGHKDVSLNVVVASDDGRLVYGGGSDGYVIVWSGNEGLDSWMISCKIKAHEMAVLCLCLVAGDDILCCGSADKMVSIWKKDITSGSFYGLGVISGHQGPVKCLQASPHSVGSGFLLYSGSLDKSLRVWWVPKNSSSSTTSTEEEEDTPLHSALQTIHPKIT